MPPLDVQLTLYNQVWTLLEGFTPFTDAFPKTGQRIKFTAGDGGMKAATRTSPAEFPSVRIRMGEDTTNQNAPRVFGHSRTDFTASMCDHAVPGRVVITVDIIHDKTDLAEQTPKEAAVRGALLSRGPNLGIAWVSRSTLRPINRREENSEDTGRSRRTISRQRLEVDIMPKLSQLTAT